MRAPLSNQVTQNLPIFKVAADQGTHPPVGLDRPVCVIGRKDYVNLPLPAKEVSKLHALIVREQRRVYLRDLASTNGVEVNGEPVREIGLSDADIVRIGSFTLRCHKGFGAKGQRPGVDGDGNGAMPKTPTAELRGKAGNFSFPPERHTLLIGQREACDVRLKHPSVAPVHAVLFEMDGRHYVQTFAPETATRVNGRPVHREALQPGDELLIGNVALRYALVDLSAETSGAATTTSMESGTGDSLIQPVLDSSIAPAIDPSHHGELEPEDADAAFDVDVVDVIDGEHESRIAPAMDSSVSPAVESEAAEPLSAGEAAEEDYGLDIEPIDLPAAGAASAGVAAGAADVAGRASAAGAGASAASAVAAAAAAAAALAGGAKPQRPTEPAPATQPPPAAIEEPVVEPIVDRAMESGIAAAIDPGASGDDLNQSMHDDDDHAPLDLESFGSSMDLEPLDLDSDPAASDDLAKSLQGIGGPGGAPAAAAGGRKSDAKLSATYDEDNELAPVIDMKAKAASDAAGGSATFDEDDHMIPLSETGDELGLGGEDALQVGHELDSPMDMPPAPMPAPPTAAGAARKRAEAKRKAPGVAEAPGAEAPDLAAEALTPVTASASAQATQSPLLDSIVGAEPTVASPLGGAIPLTEPSAPGGAGDAAAAGGSAGADDEITLTDATSDQAAQLAELAKAAGLGDGAGGESGGESDGHVSAAEITALVEEVAERSQELKEAWSEFHSENGDASTSVAAGPGVKPPGLAESRRVGEAGPAANVPPVSP